MLDIANDLSLAIDAIRTDGGTQPRAELNHGHAEELAEVLREGGRFKDPVIVYYDGTNHWLADGFHRLMATRLAGLTRVDTDVRSGTHEDAIAHSCGANATHGLRRTNEDKRRAVERIFTLTSWQGKSNREIARQCGVTEFLVRSVRDSLPEDHPSAIKSQNRINQPVERVEAPEDPRNLRVTNKNKQETLEDFFSARSNDEWEKISNVEIARQCGVTEGTVRNYKKGLLDPEPIQEHESESVSVITPAIIPFTDDVDPEDTWEEVHVPTPEPEAKPIPEIAKPALSAEEIADYHQAVKEKRQIKEDEREARRNVNRQLIAKAKTIDDALSVAKFSTIVIDPPWSWEDEGDVSQFGRGDPTYGTMTIDELLALPVGNYADDDCHIYLWITNRSLPKGFRLLDAWGFRYVTCITWVKPYFGMGNYFRGQTEHILFGVKGSQMLKRKDVGTVFEAPRGPKGHSSKPIKAYSLIESCSPGPYLELFARSERPDWTSWGAEV